MHITCMQYLYNRQDIVHVHLFTANPLTSQMLLIHPSTTTQFAQSSLKSSTAHFHNWLKANKLSLNINKTKPMVVHMPKKWIQLPLLKIAGADIEFGDNYNFLGIIINKHINWTSHVDMLTLNYPKPSVY